MRELVLLRHAQAEPAASGQHDIDRGLTARGRLEAAGAAHWMLGRGMQLDLALCSPATRARQTLEAVLDVLNTNPPWQAEPRIYQASPCELVAVAEECGDASCVLLIGHNPGLEQLVALLASSQPREYRGMPTAGVAVLSAQAGTALGPGSATLLDCWQP